MTSGGRGKHPLSCSEGTVGGDKRSPIPSRELWEDTPYPEMRGSVVGTTSPGHTEREGEGAPTSGIGRGARRKRVPGIPRPQICGTISPSAALKAEVLIVSSLGQRGGKDCFSFGERGFNKDRSVPLGPAPLGAQALECYSCVQRADNGCSPHKMRTVKCPPGVDVCTEAVGAVETSECD